MSRNDAAITSEECRYQNASGTVIGVSPLELKHTNRANIPQSSEDAGILSSEPKILRIQECYVAGENRSEIAKKEKVDRGAVARIVQFPEVQNFIAQAQQEFFGLIPDAMAASGTRYGWRKTRFAYHPNVAVVLHRRAGQWPAMTRGC